MYHVSFMLCKLQCSGCVGCILLQASVGGWNVTYKELHLFLIGQVFCRMMLRCIHAKAQVQLFFLSVLCGRRLELDQMHWIKSEGCSKQMELKAVFFIYLQWQKKKSAFFMVCTSNFWSALQLQISHSCCEEIHFQLQSIHSHPPFNTII